MTGASIRPADATPASWQAPFSPRTRPYPPPGTDIWPPDPGTSVFEQAVRSYAHLQAPVVDLKGPGFNVLGDHFSPILALLAPVYRLFPSPLTLLIAQAALFAVSTVPVTRAAAGLLGRRCGLALGIAYGLSGRTQCRHGPSDHVSVEVP